MLGESWLDSAVETNAMWDPTFESIFIFWEVVGEYDSCSLIQMLFASAQGK